MRYRTALILFVCADLLVTVASCGSGDKCKTDKDCRRGPKDGSKVCYEGRCVSLKGEGGEAAAQGGRRQVDPNVTFKVDVDLKKNPSKGPAHAPVTVVEFSDFQCPFCGRAAKTMDELAKAFPKAVRIVFMHNPLGFHKQAQLAAEASQAVFAQKGSDVFWKYHDKLFANPKELGRENLESWAKELGVDLKRFQADLDQGTFRKLVKDQQKLVNKYGGRGAPGFFINGRFVNGAQPLDRFKMKVNEALDRAQKIMATGVKPQDVYRHIMKKGKTKAVYAQ
ncbi:MAG: DsbA family protein [bacterium]